MQALMLAAGMGKRLGKFTNNNTKCMVEVAGKKLIDRAIEAIKLADIHKFIVVIGYKGDALKSYILEHYSNDDIEFIFIENKDFETTNNIYSFYLAKDYMFLDDTILLESDLIYDSLLIKRLVDYKEKDAAVVAKYESWMDGTLVTCDEHNVITQFVDKHNIDYNNLDIYYKTVNVYKISKTFFSKNYLPFLEAYIKSFGVNAYYENVLKVLVQSSNANLKAMFINEYPWYEIDDAQDLEIANVLFENGITKYKDITSKYGGFWRYSKIIDFCYLVNPYFPTKELVAKMNNEFSTLLTQYPSGLNVENMNAGRIFNVDSHNIIVGNGAAELINTLGYIIKGNVAVPLPTFNEYVRCFKSCNLTFIDNSKCDYKQDFEYLLHLTETMDYVVLVNPDNPSGFFLKKDKIIQLLECGLKNNCSIIIDESFADFAASNIRFSLLSNSFLSQYPNLIVIKSISKSFGVPGLRLGVLATANTDLLNTLRAYLPVWNINSFAEYYLQIYNLFSKDYEEACNHICEERDKMERELSEIKNIKIYHSEANYIMIDLGKTTSLQFCTKLLDKYNLLIKDLSTKQYINNKNFIRVAVRNSEDNKILINAMKSELLND